MIRRMLALRGLPAAIAALGILMTPIIASAQEGDAVAIVNGRSISKRQMVEVLMESHGLSVMQQLIVLELAKEETKRLKLRVTPEDVEREVSVATARIAPETGADGQKLTDEEKHQALEFLLQEKGLSLAEFRIGMERNAHLRKVVEKGMVVDEATLREEFARLYGEKVEVRSIQIADINGLTEALNLLEKGTDFAQVAQQVSKDSASAARGGLLEPFAFKDDQVAPVLREAAYSLKPGEVSKPIHVGRWWFILKLERRMAPVDVKFEDVRNDVVEKLHDRVVPQEMNRLVAEMFKKAEIRVLDRTLKPKFEDLVKRNALTDPTAP